MKRSKIGVLLITFCFVLISSMSYAQNAKAVGKIFTKSEANAKFGKVTESITLNTEVVKKLIERTPEYFLYNIINGKLIILDSNRNIIYGPKLNISKEQPFKFLSTSKVHELLNDGGSPTTTFEVRDSLTTITNNGLSLDFAVPCPPDCN